MTYLYRCPKCGATQTTDKREAPVCCEEMKRDYKAENATVAYHPTKGKR